MKTKAKILSSILLFFFITTTIAQTPMQDYVKKNGVEKIKKKVIVDAFSKPATHKSFKDGHGKTPYLSSTDQLPDTIALITLHINDLGGGYWVNDGKNVGVKGGNYIANLILEETINSLKEAFKKRGVVLLTPNEYLNTERKRTIYYESFEPKISKTGKFLSDLEDKSTDISVCASNYRYFDLGAAFDYKRSQSLGGVLAKELEVDGLLSVAVGFYSNNKGVHMSLVTMTVHGPNPNPKIDKKYFGQKTGTGYYNGQLYFGGTFTFKKPITTLVFNQKKDAFYPKFKGTGVIFSSFIEKYYDVMDTSIAKVSK